MIPQLRGSYNAEFSQETYQVFLQSIYDTYGHVPAFRISETPVFIPDDLRDHLKKAVEEITDTICQPNFKELSESALLPENFVPNEDDHTTFLQMDFGVCKDSNGRLFPQLIEVQGFPSLYFFQDQLASAFAKHFRIPEGMSHLFGGLSSGEYRECLRKLIVGDSKQENVILLEVEPEKQTTRIDFLGTSHHLGIPTCCVSDLKVIGKDVYYKNDSGKLVQVEKILNRVIFDELIQRTDLKREFRFTNEHNVEWIGHPHWFFRISKHTLPHLKSKYVPQSTFLSEVKDIPEDLHNYVLKPLYSFAGSGVIININRFDLDGIQEKENYILQRKVNYEPVVATPDVPAKCEVRMLMLWEKDAKRPKLVNNLVRLSKGEMIGVKYNKDKSWVGASVGYFNT